MIFLSAGCASYHYGSGSRTLPGGYRQVFIGVFKNYTQEPGIEVDFTNAIRQEFERSKIGRLSDPENAEVELTGEIIELTYKAAVPIEGGTLPTGVVLATAYDINLNVRITLKKKATGAVLWSGDFAGGRSYQAPQVTMAGVNTVNPLYNLSSRRQNIQIMSTTMMAEAHDRMTENF